MVIVDWSPFDRTRLGQGVHLPGAAARGVRADVTFRLNEAEHRRRTDQGRGAEQRTELVNAVSHVPEAWTAVAVLDLDLLDRIVDSAPELLEVRRGDSVTEVRRLITPPLAVERFTVRAADWHEGVAKVDRFASYAQRVLILERAPADLELAALEASLYGYGLAIDADGVEQEIVPPAPFLPECFTVASWHVAEIVYAAALSAGSLRN